MTNFKTVFIGIFVLFIVIGVIVFATVQSNSRSNMPLIYIWGTMSNSDFTQLVDLINKDTKDSLNVQYTQKNPETFNQDLVEALASGNGPDVFLLPQDEIIKLQNKILPIPYSVYPLRTFKDTFIQEGEMYLVLDGILGVPFTVDPLVLYWNRGLFASAGIANPPKSWEEVVNITPKLTQKDGNLNIKKSAMALGEFRNNSNAKEILSTLIMQAGNPIANYDPSFGYKSVMTDKTGYIIMPAEAALNFFIQFSNPLKSTYSWNRSLPNSLDSFLSGDLAVYLGFSSDLFKIQAKNPNLNFDVANIPQSQSQKITFGKMQALAISKASKNVNAAVKAISILTSAKNLSYLSKINNLPPVRRDLLQNQPTNPYLTVFYSAALMSKAWLDPDKAETKDILQNMVESTISGKLDSSDAVLKASQELESIMPKIN